jgi:hypothetical protein
MVETGKNLLGGIETSVTGSRLYIRNHNWCNWMRSFDVPIRVYVSVSNLDSLEYRSSGNVSCTNTLLNDSIKVDIWEGSGSVELKLEMEKAFFTLHEGAVDLTATGNVWVNFISSHGLGPVDCIGLISQYAFVSTSSPNHCYINVQQYLDGSIDNVGNVYYTGDPSTINMRIRDSGQLIRIE